MPSTTNKRSTTVSTLSDGSTIKEITEEITDPTTGTTVVTTTTIKTFARTKVLPDSSRVKENVTTKTTTTEERKAAKDEDRGVVGAFLDLFGGGSSDRNVYKSASTRESHDDDVGTRDDISFGVASSMSMESEDVLAMLPRRQYGQQHDDGIGTYEKKNRLHLSSSSISTPTQHKQRDRRRQQQHLVQKRGRQIYRQLPPARQDSVGQVTAVISNKSSSKSKSTASRSNNSTSFFRKTHPSINGNGTGASSYSSGMYLKKEDGLDYKDGGEFMLYENDRCERQLPVFHKVKGRIQNRSQSVDSGIATKRTSYTGRPPIFEQRSISREQSSRGCRTGGDNTRDDCTTGNANELDSQVVRAISTLRRRGSSPVVKGRGRSAQPRPKHGSGRPASPANKQFFRSLSGRRQQMRYNESHDVNDLDTEVRHAITSLKQRGASPRVNVQHDCSRLPQQQQGLKEKPNDLNGNAHPHDGSLRRVINSVNGRANQKQRELWPRRIGSGGHPKYIGHPSDSDWDTVSEMRDDVPTFQQVRGNPRQRARALAKEKNKTSNRMGLALVTAAAVTSTKSNFSKDRNNSPQVPPIAPARRVQYDQAILPRGSTTNGFTPKVAIDGTHAIASAGNYVHFYSFVDNTRWVQTTSVTLQDTTDISLAISNNTALIGVPYDRNSKGVMTGSAYIFERVPKNDTWIQTKKIVPKKAQEYATVGYKVDVCDNIVVVGVPELGINGGRGSVYAYQRVAQFKWSPIGRLTDNDSVFVNPGNNLTPIASKLGTIAVLRGNILVVGSNVQPGDTLRDTSLFVYEYDPTLKSKWKLLQTDLLGTEGWRQNFGSHIAVTPDGEGIFVSCNTEVNQTEILLYRRNRTVDKYGNRSFELRQIISLDESCDISDMKVAGDDHSLIVGTSKNHVYVYQQMYNLNTMEEKGWTAVAKVTDGQSGSSVGLFGDNILACTVNNVHSYSLQNWLALKGGKKKGSQGRRFMSLSPMRRRL